MGARLAITEEQGFLVDDLGAVHVLSPSVGSADPSWPTKLVHQGRVSGPHGERLEQVAGVAAAGATLVVRRTDGVVLAGRGLNPVVEPIASVDGDAFEGVRFVVAAGAHLVMVRRDGAWLWGPGAVVPERLAFPSSIARVAAEGSRVVALLADGALSVIDLRTRAQYAPRVPRALQGRVADVIVARGRVGALDDDGVVWSWASERRVAKPAPALAGYSDFVQWTTSRHGTLLVANDGEVARWSARPESLDADRAREPGGRGVGEVALCASGPMGTLLVGTRGQVRGMGLLARHAASRSETPLARPGEIALVDVVALDVPVSAAVRPPPQGELPAAPPPRPKKTQLPQPAPGSVDDWDEPPMVQTVRGDSLRYIGLFRHLTGMELATVLELAHERQLSEGETLYRPGDEARAIFIVVDGAVEVTREGAKLFRVQTGDAFGMAELLLDGVRRWTARAPSFTRLLELPESAIEHVAKEFPLLGVKLLWSISQVLALWLDDVQMLASEGDEPSASSSEDVEGDW